MLRKELTICLLALAGAGAAPPALSAQHAEPARLIDSELTRGLALPFSEIVRVGDMLYLSGMIGIRPGAMQLVPGGMAAEARQTLENIRTMLRAAGATPRDVVRCLVMLEDIADWPAFNAIYAEFFGAHRPARSALGADGLALGARVEVECTAYAPRGRGSSGGAPEATSLLDAPLYPVMPAAEARAELDRNLAEARARHEAAPDDPDAIIWHARRLGYLWRYRDAVDVLTEGVRKHPQDARMYRHRGHRYITLRRFDDAVRDLEAAARLVRGKPDEIEPDGAPNRYNIPTSTLQSNIWYHLGLAHYLRGDFERALAAYREAMKVSTNDDMRVATSDWLYMTLRRLGRDEEARAVLAPIRRDMRILENHAYHRRLLMYKGELPADSLLGADAEPLDFATQGYGVGNWYLVNGEREKAYETFRRVVAGSYWSAFGHIAAEAELARLASGGDSTAAAEVLAAVEGLFDAMRARDEAALRRLLHPRAVIYSTRAGAAGAFRSTDEFVALVAGSTAQLDERIYTPRVDIENGIASVWGYYDFRRDGELSHCGSDAFHLIREGAGWRFIAVTYTVREECP